MSNEKLREEFEAWFSVNVPDINNLAAARAVKHMMIKELAFLTWQASRECLVIELPKPGSDCYWEESVGDEDAYFDYGKYNQDLIEAIHAAGVKTK